METKKEKSDETNMCVGVNPNEIDSERVSCYYVPKIFSFYERKKSYAQKKSRIVWKYYSTICIIHINHFK